jgi:2-polyprenyl-3-methyl-5-hydroxy-6-metoxy-1,4-benzoquinol methylase
MPGKYDETSGSKFTRMWFSDDMANLNVRREHLAHVLHYKKNVHEMKRLARQLGRPLHILDVGCGEANTLRMFYTADQTKKSDVVASYTGIDGDPSVIERTKKRAGTLLKGVNGSVRVCDITKYKFPVDDGSIDMVICNEVMEHIPQEAGPKVLRKIRKALCSEGLALISTPNKDGTNDRLPADHVYEYGYAELHGMFEAAGLQEVDELGVYIQQAKLRRFIKEEHGDELLKSVDDVWDRYGLDIGSIMTADLARPVANNLIHVLRPA